MLGPGVKNTAATIDLTQYSSSAMCWESVTSDIQQTVLISAVGAGGADGVPPRTVLFLFFDPTTPLDRHQNRRALLTAALGTVLSRRRRSADRASPGGWPCFRHGRGLQPTCFTDRLTAWSGLPVGSACSRAPWASYLELTGWMPPRRLHRAHPRTGLFGAQFLFAPRMASGPAAPLNGFSVDVALACIRRQQTCLNKFDPDSACNR